MTWSAVLGALLVAAPLAAQQRRDPVPPLTALLARAESLESSVQKTGRARLVESQALHRGQVLQAGHLVAVLWETVNPAVGQHLVATIDSTVGSFGGGPVELLDHIVVVQLWTTDTARILSRPELARRRRVELDWTELDNPDAGASRLIGRIERLYRATLDSAWQRWLPTYFGFIAWDPQRNANWALAALTNPDVATGQGCLTGRVAQCRLWLGLDDDARPIAMRYRASEIRRRLAGGVGWYGGRDRQQCVSGDDPACFRYAEAHEVINPIPAPDAARASFVRALWALHGPQALARAFADTHGSVGERFARAASIREDSLVAEWRAWTLGRGRTERLAASLPQSLIVLLVVTFAVWAAARSGRWR